MPGADPFQQAVIAAFEATDPDTKCEAVARIPEPDAPPMRAPRAPLPQVGRPRQPLLVDPARVPRRRLGSPAGRAALLHAVAHIEFNAINLALDACWRFPGLPLDYYRDWLSVARDEARHFALLRERLTALGTEYGDLPAHNGLWEAAEKTARDVLVRMALVPRVLEARGLDVSPGMIERLRSVADTQSAELLALILREEVRHVQIGTRWFRHLCHLRGLDPDSVFPQLLREYGMGLRPPLNEAARSAAGFSRLELERALAWTGGQGPG